MISFFGNICAEPRNRTRGKAVADFRALATQLQVHRMRGEIEVAHDAKAGMRTKAPEGEVDRRDVLIGDLIAEPRKGLRSGGSRSLESFGCGSPR